MPAKKPRGARSPKLSALDGMRAKGIFKNFEKSPAENASKLREIAKGKNGLGQYLPEAISRVGQDYGADISQRVDTSLADAIQLHSGRHGLDEHLPTVLNTLQLDIHTDAKDNLSFAVHVSTLFVYIIVEV